MPSAAPTSHMRAGKGRNNWHTLITGTKMEVLLAGHAASGTWVSQLAAIGETSHSKPGADSAIHPQGQREASSRNVSKGQKTFARTAATAFSAHRHLSSPSHGMVAGRRRGSSKETTDLRRQHGPPAPSPCRGPGSLPGAGSTQTLVLRAENHGCSHPPAQEQALTGVFVAKTPLAVCSAAENTLFSYRDVKGDNCWTTRWRSHGFSALGDDRALTGSKPWAD